MSDAEPRPIKAVTLREQVAEALRQAILSGQLKPGERLREVDLARRFGVSRNPIREAIGELEQQGLIVSVPNQGKTVVSPTEEELQHAFQIRVCLELLALRLAWPYFTEERLQELRRLALEMRQTANDDGLSSLERHGRLNTLDAQFHSRLIEWSGNRALMRAWFAASPWGLAFISDLEQDLGAGRERSGSEAESPAATVDPHEVFLTAIARGDQALAEELLASHVGRSRPSAGARGGSQPHLYEMMRDILDRAVAPPYQQGESS